MPIEKCGLYHKQCRELCTAAANDLLKDEEIKPESNAKRKPNWARRGLLSL